MAHRWHCKVTEAAHADGTRQWPHKYQFLERVRADRHERAETLFDSLLWAVGEGPCAGLRSARRAAGAKEMDMAAARIGVESALRTLHSSGDLLAQLVAVCLFDPPPAPSDIAMNWKKFKEPVRAVAPTIAGLFDALQEDDSWRYVADATNTLKHVEALQVVFSLGGGITLVGFRKSKSEYPDRSLDEISTIIWMVQEQLWDLAWALYEMLDDTA
jgi:hypothetical protein